MKLKNKSAMKKLTLNACTLALGAASVAAHAADKPNIVVIFVMILVTGTLAHTAKA